MSPSAQITEDTGLELSWVPSALAAIPRVDTPSTVGERRAMLSDVDDAHPLYNELSEPPVVIVTPDYVGIG